ncbi:unnamed protein product, partial [Cuscuta epithymum]
MIPKVTDSAVWRRICSIDQQASILCSLNPSGHLIWDEEADGLFSFKSAYEAVRDHKVSSDVYKNIWESKQELKIKIFQWKIVKGIIPITDKLGRFKQVLNPSMCPLCRRQSDSLIHLFFQCNVVEGVWRYFWGILGLYMPLNSDLNISRVLRMKNGGHSLLNIFRQNISGILLWFIWKVYSSIIWGNEDSSPSTDQIIFQIKMYTQSWAVSLSGLKIRQIGDILFEEQLIPRYYKPNITRPQIIKWRKPKQRWKLNIDASYLSDLASGGAILRSSSGQMIQAISFPLEADSALDAEIKALCFVVRWVEDEGYEDVEVETDSLMLLEYFSRKDCRRWKILIQETSEIMNRKRISILHTLREGNWVAHFLAVGRALRVIKFDDPNVLPIQAKRAYWMDYF